MKNTIEDKIIIHNKVYNFLVDCAEYYFKSSDVDKAIMFCQHAASYATFNYCGFYVDGRLENILLLIGKKSIKSGEVNVSQIRSASRKKKILHYASSIHEVGGHTRLIENWIKNDNDNCHDLVLTMQEEPIPRFILEAVKSVEGEIFVINDNSTIKKASSVFELVNNYDIIVLHHHANDVIPLIAFSSEFTSPVCILNHGDHRFWLGSAICDVLIEIRDNLIDADRLRRNISKFSLLPIPVKHQEIGSKQYNEARLKLGVSDEEVMLLSIGSSYKYIPFDGRNFFDDLSGIFKRKNVKLFVVGINPDEELALKYKGYNINFIAPTSDLGYYQKACDIYLEGFPFSSFTAYLEIADLGKPIHRMYNPPLLNEYKLSDYPHPVIYPTDKTNWRLTLEKMIDSDVTRLELGSNEKDNAVIHGADSWKKYLKTFYADVKSLHHKVKEINNSDLILDANGLYLYKMQEHNKYLYPLFIFYNLPLITKMKVVISGLIDNFCKEKLDFRTKLWFIFKSGKYVG